MQVSRAVLVTFGCALALAACSETGSAPTVAKSTSSTTTSARPLTGACKETPVDAPPSPAPTSPKRPYGSGVAVRSSQAEAYGDDPPDVIRLTAQPPQKARSSTGDDPDPGMQYVTIAVSASLTQGDEQYLSSFNFALYDPKGNLCDTASYQGVVDKAKEFDSGEVRKGATPVTGQLAFIVPAGDDLKSLRLAYNGAESRVASVVWQS